MSTHLIVPFDVTGWEQTAYDTEAPGPRLFRVTVRKTYRGELAGDGVAELLMCVADEDDLGAGAGYVVSERIVGALDGRAGSFVIQHWGVSGDGVQATAGHVVPGSGTDELQGLRGTVAVSVADDGAHSLTFDYELPA